MLNNNTEYADIVFSPEKCRQRSARWIIHWDVSGALTFLCMPLQFRRLQSTGLELRFLCSFSWNCLCVSVFLPAAPPLETAECLWPRPPWTSCWRDTTSVWGLILEVRGDTVVAIIGGVSELDCLRAVIYKPFHWNLWKEEACGKTQGRALKWRLPCYYYASLHISKMAAPQEVGHACVQECNQTVFSFFFFQIKQSECIEF